MYHVNPTSGNTGVCRAGSPDGCPFGTPSEHYENANQARDAFEAKMGSQTLQVLKKTEKSIRSLPPAENKARAEFKADKAELKRAQAEVSTRENSPIQASPPSESRPTQTQSRPSQSTSSVKAPNQNKSKAEFEFDKADLKYQRAALLLHEEGAIHNLDWKDVEKYKAERDELAVELGRPTVADQENAGREKARTDRAQMSKKLIQLRAGVRSAEVGSTTDRGRLHKVERNLLHQYEMDRSNDPSEQKDIWVLKQSVANYEVDETSKNLKELGSVSFISSRAKKEDSETLNIQLRDASRRLAEANAALGQRSESFA